MHETMAYLYTSELVDEKAMLSFDALCLKSINEINLSQTQYIREELKSGNICCMFEKNK